MAGAAGAMGPLTEGPSGAYELRTPCSRSKCFKMMYLRAVSESGVQETGSPKQPETNGLWTPGSV